ncbi:MAG: chemotaxis protein CheW [Candidatus Altiarchaeota archaeon]|nr:chemotaxis protein CheW [Candidatus Altiarchaeota archaeon]
MILNPDYYRERQREIGLVADRIVEQQEIMIKALDKEFRGLKGIAGASILSDGNLALVIDISGIT